MSTLKKVIAVVTSLTLVTMLFPAGFAQAMTAEELQQQIASLQAQLAQLQTQLVSMQGGGESQGGAISGVPAGFTFEKNLKLGMSGLDVKYLQIVLNSDPDTKLADSGVGSAGHETEYFGPLTKAAVVKFQEKYADEVLAKWGLTKGTGFVGSTTRAKLNALLAANPAPNPNPNPNPNPAPSGAGLTVSLASDNPVAGTIVADSTSADGAQSLIPMLKVKLVNGDSSDVKVTQMKFTRDGISADSDVSQAYLYDGDDQLAEYNSFSDRVLTFSNSAGLFTVPAGGSKEVTLKMDLADGTAAGKTVRFSVQASSDVVSDASAVSGDFPLVGNYMTTAQASDLGKLTVALGTAPASTADPQEGFEVFNVNVTASDQDIEIRKMVFTNIGSTAADDLTNFKLYDGGTQVGSTIANMASDKTVTFDLSSSPLAIEKGVTKNLHLKADIVGGTNRTFQFSIQNMTDVLAYDTQYKVYVKPNQSDSWSILTAANATTINTGKLTISRSSDSPSGNVPAGGTNISVAKFDVKATGEDVKITSLKVRLYGTIATNGLYQGKVYFDGSQKGSTTNLSSASSDSSSGDTEFTFGNTFVVPAGETKTLEIKADIKTKTGGSLSSGNFTTKISSVTATGKVSLATVSVSSAAAYQLTIATGTLSASKNQAVADWTSSYPTGVQGATDVLVGSFVVTAGSAEGADITAVKITDSSSTFSHLQNLKVYKGDKSSGTQIGSTQSSLTAGTSYTFYASPYISLDASEQVTVNVYADISTGASVGAQGHLVLDEVDGYGKTTNTSVNYTTDTAGQTVYIASAGSLTVAQDSSAPKTSQVIMGTNGVEFNKVKFTAGAGEDIKVTQVVVTATLEGGAPTSTLKNVAISGDGLSATVASLASNGTATFDLTANPWIIPASSDKVMTIAADINPYPYASSGADVKLGLASSAVTSYGVVSGNSGGTSASVSGNAMYTYKTKVEVALNSSSPSGSSFPGANQHVLYFDVTNDGSYDAYFNYATFTINYSQGTGNATTAASRTFYLYDSADTSNSIGSGSIAAGTTINGATIAIDVSPDYAVPAGTTKTFYLVGDTSDCGVASGSNAGSRIQFYISSAANFNWDDNVSTSVISNTKTFPLYGNTLTY